MQGDVGGLIMRNLWALAAVVMLVGCDSDSDSSTSTVFFGDLHAHSTFSAPDRVGKATPEDFYRVARDQIGFDFVALSDHDSFLTQEEWDVIRATAPIFDDPGTFVAFSAIEWTHRWHMNTIFRRDDEEICDCSEASQYYDHHRDLIEAREAAGHLNHPTDVFLPTWSEIDDTLTKNVEVFNASAPEQELGYGGAIWSLRAGFRFGFVGVSDDHMTDAMPPRIGNGVTACHARSLTREAILDALHERRCYATTRERIIVDTEVAGVAMGGVATGEIGAIVPARVEITATELPATIELVLNGEVVADRACDQLECELAADIRIDDPNNFVYARVFQPEGQMAWSTPVWINASCARDDSRCLDGRLFPGGVAEDDCLTEILLPATASEPTYRAEPLAIRCRDGDPTCDSDEVAGECSIRLGLCFSVEDPRLPGCAAAAVATFEVVEPAADAARLSFDWQNRSTLNAIFRAAHTDTEKNRCSGLSGLRIAAGDERTIRLASSAGERVDRDTFTLACLP